MLSYLLTWKGTWLRSLLRRCATSRKVADSFPDGVICIFHWHNPVSTFLPWCCFLFNMLYFKMSCCIVVVVLFVLLSSCVYLLYYMCIAVFTSDAGLLARSQYSEGPATGHLDTGFLWSPCVYKQMLRSFQRFQVATTCFLCSPPDLNLLVTSFMFCLHVK